MNLQHFAKVPELFAKILIQFERNQSYGHIKILLLYLETSTQDFFMNRKDLTFEIRDNGCRICAICNGTQIGSLFFVRSGPDKIIISDAEIDSNYSAKEIELYLVQEVISMARAQNRKVISICPYISDIFMQHPEFDDVRLLNNGR